MSVSVFLKWFEEQHGKRSAGKLTDSQLQDRINAGLAASAELKQRIEWDARRESALYAWQARGRV